MYYLYDQTLNSTWSCHVIFLFPTLLDPSPMFLQTESLVSLCGSSFTTLCAFFFCSSIHMDRLSPSNSSASLEFCYQIQLFFVKDVSPSPLLLKEYVNELYSLCLSCCHFCAKAVKCGKLGLILHSFSELIILFQLHKFLLNFSLL